MTETSTPLNEHDYPELFDEWNFDKNNGKFLNDFTKGSKHKAWWICEKGHEWEAMISSRVKGKKCVYCTNKELLIGFNDFATVHPELLHEWDYEKNAINPQYIRFNSDEEVYWNCDKGHFWKNKISYRSKGYGKCIQCVSLYENFPELIEEWDYEKNVIDPKKVRYGSVEKVWWIGKECGHSWITTIRGRTRDRHGCPYCSGQKILQGFNDLATTHPDIAQQWSPKNDKKATEVSKGTKSKEKFIWTDECGHEWRMSIQHRTLLKDLSCPVCKSIIHTHPELTEQLHKTKNKDIDLKFISVGNSEKIWWKHPECGHEWEQSVWSRSVNSSQCQVCINKQILVGYNDFPTLSPELFKEWNFEKNTIDPYSLTIGSNRKVWWKCEKKHEWKAIVSDRSRGSKCPECSIAEHISQPEKELTEFIEECGVKVVSNSRKILKSGRELDLYIPEKNIAIEFNGLYWHSEEMIGDKNYHYNKWKECQQLGIQLITVWEDDWKFKKEIIKKSLTHKLNKSDQKVYARKTFYTETTMSEAKEFANNNHIQGFVHGSKYLSLKDKENNKTVALMIVKEYSNGKLYLERYCTSQNVVGGFTKLLKIVEQEFSGIEKIITFADHTISDGGLYENNGFEKESELKPDYSYLVNNKRKHKFNYRLKRFKNDPELIWEDGLTERQLAKLNNLKRIYDAGKTKFVKILNKTDNKTKERE